MRRLALSLVVFVALAGACRASTKPAPSASASASSPVASASGSAAAAPSASAASAEAAPSASASASAAASVPGVTEGCPAGMVLVEGEYCPAVEQRCLEHDKEFEKEEAKKQAKKAAGDATEAGTASERCLRYEQPSKCLSKKRVHMRFCMDRYEWPNEKGELPAFLVSWTDAKKQCEAKGKRLCGENEFNFACEGEAMLPYTYGYDRDASKCNIDKPYRKRERTLAKYDRCMKRPACKAEIEKLDQRVPAGSLAACVSPFGVYDLNGNINEWVVRSGPKLEYPNRSGLKGGWWGPVRGRCRPTVGFHKEDDYGYEEGFRCCGDAG